MFDRRGPVSRPSHRGLVAAVFGVLSVALATVVLAQAMPTPVKAEITDAGGSWPHEVKAPVETCAGKSMATLLTEIHDKAMDAWAAAPAADKPTLRQVISLSLTCLAYDGNMAGTPGAAHAAGAPGIASHAGAKAKVLAAYAAAFPVQGPPPSPLVAPDWARASQELDHGH